MLSKTAAQSSLFARFWNYTFKIKILQLYEGSKCKWHTLLEPRSYTIIHTDQADNFHTWSHSLSSFAHMFYIPPGVKNCICIYLHERTNLRSRQKIYVHYVTYAFTILTVNLYFLSLQRIGDELIRHTMKEDSVDSETHLAISGGQTKEPLQCSRYHPVPSQCKDKTIYSILWLNSSYVCLI